LERKPPLLPRLIFWRESLATKVTSCLGRFISPIPSFRISSNLRWIHTHYRYYDIQFTTLCLYNIHSRSVDTFGFVDFLSHLPLPLTISSRFSIFLGHCNTITTVWPPFYVIILVTVWILKMKLYISLFAATFETQVHPLSPMTTSFGFLLEAFDDEKKSI
jgi:hypothetical protein